MLKKRFGLAFFYLKEELNTRFFLPNAPRKAGCVKSSI